MRVQHRQIKRVQRLALIIGVSFGIGAVVGSVLSWRVLRGEAETTLRAAIQQSPDPEPAHDPAEPRAVTLRPILLLHSFRFVGLAFLVPGVVSPDLPDSFARPAAYGDLTTAILALLGVATLKRPIGMIVVWVFNVVGTTDLIYAFYQGGRTGLDLSPGLQGAAYFMPTVLVPLLIVTHVIVFRILLKGYEAIPADDALRRS